MSATLLLQGSLTAISILIYFITLSIIGTAIKKIKTPPLRSASIKKTAYFIKKFFGVLLFFVLLLVIALIWGIDIRGVLILASSFFAVVGVSLFASWSVLSNITAGTIIFFAFPYKIGDKITIIDGENSVTGEIVDMTLFHIRITDEDKNQVSYPNNIIVQKPVLVVEPADDPSAGHERARLP